MDIYALSGFLNGIAATLLGLLVLFRHTKDPRHRTFGLYCLSIALWGYGYGLWQLADDAPRALLLIKICMAGAVLIPVTYFHHVLVLLDQVPRHFRLLLGSYVIALSFVGSLVSRQFILTVEPRSDFPFWPVPGVMFHAYLLWFCCTVGFTTYLLGRAYRQASGIRRNQFLYLLIGSVIGYAGGSTNFPLWYGLDVPPVGTIAITVFVSLTAYTMLRFRLLDISAALEKGLIYLLLLGLMGLPAYGFLILMERRFFGYVDSTFSFLLFLVFCVIVFAAYRYRAGTQDILSKMLFRNRYDKYETLAKFSRDLVTILELNSLSKTIVQTLGTVMGSDPVMLFGRTSAGVYRLWGSHVLRRRVEPPHEIPSSNPLVATLKCDRNILIRDELPEPSAEEQPARLRQQLDALQADICLPFIHKHELVGFCTLGGQGSRETYSMQDIAFLKTLIHEAAIALDNACLYEELKRSQALVQRTDRLRSLETMAGSLAHEIRNPLTSIKTFMQMIPGHAEDVEFLQQFGAVVSEDVARIERLTKEILDYARPTEPVLQKQSVNEIVESCLETIRARSGQNKVQIEIDLASDLPKALVDRQQMKQVVLNLMLNAIEATDETGGCMWVRTRTVVKSGREEWVQIKISHAGHGIPATNFDQIFDPLSITRHPNTEREGSGLGLAIAFHIVREHRGYLDVSSQPGSGMTFCVSLPSVRERATSPTS